MKTCKQCGAEFHNSKHPRQVYCSTTCRDAAQTRRVSTPCAHCGKLFDRFRYRVAQLDKGYCSKQCLLDATRRTVRRACETCGTSVERSPAHIADHIFCSVECNVIWQRTSGYISGERSPSWRGGHTEYRGPNWNQQQRAALARDNSTCQACGATSALQVHHKRPYQTFDHYTEANDLANLVTLCMRCHTTAEWEYRKAHPGYARSWPIATRIHTCTECGQPFAARSPRSLRCDQCWHRTCHACGKTFRPRLWHEENKYCSRVCAGTSKKAPS